MMTYFGPETEVLYNVFMEYAKTSDDIKFFHNEDSACAAEFGASAPGLVFFRNFDEEVVVWDGSFDESTGEGKKQKKFMMQIREWVLPLMVETVFEFTAE